jgi:hypothetical protein
MWKTTASENGLVAYYPIYQRGKDFSGNNGRNIFWGPL